MKVFIYLIITACFFTACRNNNPANDRQSLDKTKAAIRDAFARGDVSAVVALHHPDVVKYFGGDNVVKGRDALAKSLTETFKTSRLVFIENQLESATFNGETAIETCIFKIRITPRKGGESTYFRGRSMVAYVRYKNSPFGWVSIREMVQTMPGNK